MSEGMFGDFAVEDIPLTIPKGTYKLTLMDVQDKEAQNENFDDPDRRYLILNFEISGGDDADDYIGERPNGVFINYWPGLTEEQFKAFDNKAKANWKMNFKNFQTVAIALGADREDVEKGRITPQDIESYVGTEVFCDLFNNKQQQAQLSINSMKNAETVDMS
jgi:hypothetical protein